MMDVELKENVVPCFEDLIELYDNAGWINYTKRSDMLLKAYENSLLVISAWHKEELLGIIRVVGDGYSIVYIQDVIVHSKYQRMGIGSKLIKEVLNRYQEVYQTVLLTENIPERKAFYENMGLLSCDEYGCISYVRFLN